MVHDVVFPSRFSDMVEEQAVAHINKKLEGYGPYMASLSPTSLPCDRMGYRTVG